MSDTAATIISALIGFIGGLIVAAFTLKQKADELFLAGLQYLSHGSQNRNLGIAAMELSWSSRRHRRVIARMFVGVAVYLLLKSEQKDAAHELLNLDKIMTLLTDHHTRPYLNIRIRKSLFDALMEKSNNPESDPGLWVTKEKIEKWIKCLKESR